MHRFEDGFALRRGQWLADGNGLARMVAKEGWRGAGLLALPAARRGPRDRARPWRAASCACWPYYACYLVFNYAGMVRRRT